MKSNIAKRMMAVIGLMILVSAASAFAQTAPLRANIPFAFTAGEQVLPAGVYRVVIDSQFRRLDVRSINAISGVVLSANKQFRGHSPDTATLIFHKYGNTYFLKQVWPAGRNDGYGLPATSAEREMARNAPTEIAVVRLP